MSICQVVHGSFIGYTLGFVNVFVIYRLEKHLYRPRGRAEEIVTVVYVMPVPLVRLIVQVM